MSERRLTIYQRNTGRPIVLTDKMNVQSISEFKKQLVNIMSGEDKIIQFQTIDDLLVIRSDEIGGIMLSAEGQFKEVIPLTSELVQMISSDVKNKSILKSQPPITKEDKPQLEKPTDKSDYEQILIIEESTPKTSKDVTK
jgi:hypothetical protein